jgi:tetratricopeptide (TPR) repeat protein
MFALILDALRRRLGPAKRGTLVVTGLVCAALLAYGIKTMTYSRVWKSAETFWLTTLKGNPDCWAGWYNLGNQYNREANAYRREHNAEKAAECTDKAIEFYAGAVEAKPNLIPAYRQLLLITLHNKRYAAMEKHCNGVEHYRPLLAHYFRGQMCNREKQWAEAVGHYERALRSPATRDEKREIVGRLAECLMRLKRWEDAIRRYKQLLTLRPSADDRYKAHMGLGSCYHQLGKLDQAEAQFKKALEVRPNDRNASNYLKLIREKRQEEGERGRRQEDEDS